MKISDQTCTIAQLKDQIRHFVEERDWEQFHTPKDLAIGLSVEAAELLEHFRFQSEAEVEKKLADEASLKDIGHELADVLYFVLLMCDRFGLDAAATLEEKLAISAARYPIAQARGKNLKYTQLEREGT
ncbi:MAG: nucleotide pyrophosphohydrolase [Candidatus Latescibacterota bacterium]|nr:nucleotide pyrophosphohydrolase [Candidatus Latescibacterota bacterium]